MFCLTELTVEKRMVNHSGILCVLGHVSYRSRYLRGDTYKANMEAKRIVVSEMGTMAYPDPRKNIFSK